MSCSFAQAPATSSRGGEGGSGLGPWETRRAAAGGVCVCAEEAAGAGGGWEEAFAEAPPKSYAVLYQEKYSTLQRVRVACPLQRTGVRTVACFSHSTTMRETTVCYLRPKRGPTGKAAGRALRESVDSGPLFQETMVRERAFATILARGWLAAQASVMPPALPRPGLPRCECEVLVSYHPTVKRGSTFNKQESRVTHVCIRRVIRPDRDQPKPPPLRRPHSEGS